MTSPTLKIPKRLLLARIAIALEALVRELRVANQLTNARLRRRRDLWMLLAVAASLTVATGCGKPKPSTTTWPAFNANSTAVLRVPIDQCANGQIFKYNGDGNRLVCTDPPCNAGYRSHNGFIQNQIQGPDGSCEWVDVLIYGKRLTLKQLQTPDEPERKLGDAPCPEGQFRVGANISQADDGTLFDNGGPGDSVGKCVRGTPLSLNPIVPLEGK